MALKCDNCYKGILIGSMVSPAKNRLRRVFKPNLQKLKVVINGKIQSAKLCTRCIKKLKKDKVMGIYSLNVYVDKTKIQPVVKVKKVEKTPIKIEKAVKSVKSEEKFSIDSLVGKKG
jgi:large subunit ribosomal protein L28